MNKKEELRAIASKAMAEMREIEHAEKRERNKELVGKCFAYRNCYSCPETQEDYWTLWQKVIELTEDGEPVTFAFQIDKYGEARIYTRESMSSLGDPSTQEAFNAAWEKTLLHITSLHSSAVGE